MKKWYVITGILACLLVVSVVVSLNKVDELGTEVQLQREEGYTIGYEDGLSTGREQGYDAGNYDGWWTGYDQGYDHGITYGKYLAGERPITYILKSSPGQGAREWREYWRDQGIYDKGYAGFLPD